MPAKPARILIVDDETAHMRALCDILAQEGFATEGASSGPEALELLSRLQFDLILTDLMMPEMDGITLLRGAQLVQPQLVGIVMTGQGTIGTAVQAMQAGALDYIQKPFRLNLVLPVLRRAIVVRDLRLANEELEQRVRERTAQLESANLELETANKDLEAFSFSVSHDLRAPLRTIAGYLEMYEADYGDTIPTGGRPLLDVVRQGATKMDRLIEDLLQFSRCSRQTLSQRTVPMAAVVRRLVDELRGQERDRQIEFVIADLPDCKGDPALLEQVMVNLLANAVKFTRVRESARIEVGSRDQAGERVYYVRDNGAGFDASYAHKLFGVFQRLHSADQFEGTGVGLSIVHRIVTRHGGRVWAESELDNGATFYVALPN
jgi:two-component system sensor histidine kinase/response regulator